MTASNPNHNRCRGTRRDGQPCPSPILDADGYCFAHRPGADAARRQARQAGGRHRAALARLRRLCPPRLGAVYDRLDAALEAVEAGRLHPAQAQAMASLARALVAVLQAGELEARVRELEARFRQGADARGAA